MTVTVQTRHIEPAFWIVDEGTTDHATETNAHVISARKAAANPAGTGTCSRRS